MRHFTLCLLHWLRPSGRVMAGVVILNTIVNIGYGNMVMAAKVVAVLSPDSAPMRRLKDEAKERKMLIDATQGRKTRAIIITDSDHVILSAVQAETLMLRFSSRGGE